MRKFHITNEAGRDTVVRVRGLRPEPAPQLGHEQALVQFRRYIAATDAGLHDALVEQYGDDYAQAILDADPEIDFERVGRAVGETQNVFAASDGSLMHAAPDIVEVIYEASGQERERRSPQESAPNVNEGLPVYWTGKKLPRGAVVRRFAFRRHLQLVHSDGLSFDYLFAIAKELDEADEVVLLGAGPKGKAPLVFQTNGSPYRGFLEGRISAKRYQLFLHLSNMELKVPTVGEFA